MAIFKLLAALGAWCGWQVLPQVLLLASASGLVWTLLQRLWTRQSLQQPLAFGPWLALAGGGIFSLAADGLAFAIRLAGQDAAGSGGYEYFLLRRVGAALAGSSGQTCFG
ncbi:Leader peptidase (Prepilin peptidase) [Klebsiella pneumoniae]|uniref:Leader peptidase (Prepilin peptidase) n=1 Tax=Klebsiella pneumoniae TaxID=573 RepID=A0A3S4HCX8_KLEPN|nr:Leader peptidase (Prepilin peptidase) [Klebsiella pneumoniae]